MLTIFEAIRDFAINHPILGILLSVIMMCVIIKIYNTILDKFNLKNKLIFIIIRGILIIPALMIAMFALTKAIVFTVMVFGILMFLFALIISWLFGD